MTTIEFFEKFWAQVRTSANWQTMVNTVEDSPWHREANVAVHTTMCIEKYMGKFFHTRNERQRALTLMALLFHDFGKPEAEETLEKKEEPGVFYRRYAGHEPISANEFLSFMIDNHELREMFFAQGFDWTDIRKIKVMIEHHLPYGLKNEQKRQNLAYMIDTTLGADEVAYYDMLRCDAAGRISDGHEEKLKNVEEWIENFQLVSFKERKVSVEAPLLVMLVGVSGAGKSTYIKNIMENGKAGVQEFAVFSEDVLRLEYAEQFLDRTDFLDWNFMSAGKRYQKAWEFCHLNKESKFDQYSKAKFHELLAKGGNIIVDRMNQGRKGRNGYIQPAKDKGYRVQSIEFLVSESTAVARQESRGDKELNAYRVHQLYMQLETPWYGPEVDNFLIIEPT